jgi:hypothetical protein
MSKGVVYDNPPLRKCPYNMKSANGGSICFREFNKTPILESLEKGTDFPAPETSISNKPNRLSRDHSLTEMLGGNTY